jgi:hypothetical protein
MRRNTGIAKQRKANAERQAKLRERRDAARQCRTCGRPVTVVVKPDGTERVPKQCNDHLGADARRKVSVIPLPWKGRPSAPEYVWVNGHRVPTL